MGRPTGLNMISPGPVSPDGEYGQAIDPVSVAARDLKAQYQDEGIVGFDKRIGESWVAGAKVTVRKLRTAIDDVCDTGLFGTKLAAQGIDPDSVTIPGCVIFNPGNTNTFSLANANGVVEADPDPLGYGSLYHNCNGEPSHPGDKRYPWVKQLDMAITYRPGYFDSKLALGLSVFNVTNERKPLNASSTYEASPQTVSNTYDVGSYYQNPRYARLTATYDF